MRQLEGRNGGQADDQSGPEVVDAEFTIVDETDLSEEDRVYERVERRSTQDRPNRSDEQGRDDEGEDTWWKKSTPWIVIGVGVLMIILILSSGGEGGSKGQVADQGEGDDATTLVVNLDPLRDGPFIVTGDTLEFTLRNTPGIQGGHEASWLWGSGASIGIEDMHGNVYTLEDGKNVRFAPDIKDFTTFKAWVIPGSKVKKTTLTVVEKLPSVKLK